MSDVLYPEVKKVTIAGRELEVKKLPFKRFMQVSGIASSLDFDNPANMAVSADKVIDILAIALGADKIFLEENLGVEEARVALKAVLEINKTSFTVPQDPGVVPAK